jgi:hypothetical protein
MKEIEIKKQELARYALMNGDILFTEGGDRDKLGRGVFGEVRSTYVSIKTYF